MEIEAKFAVPDVATFQRLQAVEHVAGFSLSAHQVQQVRDTYLDTEERLILASGYACRRRETESEVLITLKGLGRADGGIHRRMELEISLPSYEAPQEWPDSPVRDLVLEVTGGADLIPLFDLRQTRVFRRMSHGELLVAQLSLDNVRVTADRRRSHFELEVELAPQGAASDMAAIVTFLQDEWDLIPEPRSKFERALAFLDQDGPGGALLSAQERALCVQIAKRDHVYARRARGLLLLDEDVAPDDAAEQVERTPRRVKRWLQVFEEKRLSSFPERILREVQSTPAAILPHVPSPEVDETEREETSSPHPEPQPLKALFKRYLVDRAHARRVADHALTLFDELSPLHGLPPERRLVVETAAMVHNIGLASDPESDHTAGRDILLAHPPKELDEEERLMVALSTYLHSGGMTSEKLKKKTSKDALRGLPTRAREQALALSALVRMADGLDYSQTQSSGLGQVVRIGDLVDIEVTGPYAAIDAARAQEKGDLWRLLFETEVRFLPGHVARDTLAVHEKGREAEPVVDLVPKELPVPPHLSTDDTMAEAARKILTFHFQRMLYHEPGTRAGEDIEELHDMRVATRRMRAAFRVFEDYLDKKRLKPFRKGVGRTCDRLGTVRDLDVLWEKTERYLDGLPPERRGDLMPLREAWEAEREEGREKMVAYLDDARYARFRERSAELLQTGDVWESASLTKKGEAVAYRLRHVVPVAVYERAAAVLAYDEWVDRPDVSLKRLHRLRIAGKRLRYTLEFFEELLAPQAGDLIGQMKRLQDHLGDLQDALVASELLRDFLTWGTWGHTQDKKGAKVPKEPIVAPAVAVYLADRQAELQHLLRTFPDVWAYFQSPEFKQTVAVIVAPL
ncbi:MAG: CHAD domain-containing protein [Chloroflexota bacterium]|nr:CHAD domain-containing protein [Chloroflexota bacterium]